MDTSNATVLLIDDDDDVRESVGRLLRSAGWNTELFSSAQDFLTRPPFAGTGCILLDISMPEMTGPQLHGWIRENGISLPVIYLSGHCDVPSSVLAMKHGAMDVLEKPADADVLLDAIAGAVEQHRLHKLRRDAKDEIHDRLASLSAREREVMDQVILGRLTKQIAAGHGQDESAVSRCAGAPVRPVGSPTVAARCDRVGRIADCVLPPTTRSPVMYGMKVP